MSLLLERFAHLAAAGPDHPAVIEASGEPVGRAQLLQKACTLADDLQAAGVRRGSVVLIHAPGAGAAFHAGDLAALLCGAVPASMTEHPSADQADQTLNVLRPACVLDTAGDDVLTAATTRAEIPHRHLASPAADSVSAEQAVRRARMAPAATGACVTATSGTTGRPRHVLIDQTAIVNGLAAWRHHWPSAAQAATRTVAHLPVSHIAQRIMGHYLLCLYGVSVHTATPADLAAAITTARPQILLGVPHTLAALAQDAAHDAELGQALREIALIINGAAALPADTAAALTALGAPVAGAYGMTETTVPAFHHHPEDGSGTLGMLVPGVQFHLGANGALRLRTSYAARYVTCWPQTTPVMAADGWLHTGDRATLVRGGLRLTGRIAATLKTSRGHLIAPEPIEAHLAAQPDVAGACVLGHGRPTAVAVVSLPAAQTWDEPRRAQVEAELLTGLRDARTARALPRADIGSVLIVTEDWSTDVSLLTRTGKPRRKVIAGRYAGQLTRRYEQQASDER
jgi:long-chain acyl-CoA synthetase